MKHWLVKQEPEIYPFSQFVADKRTDWTGVRNFQARNYLRAMSVGDAVLFYHSGAEKAIAGTAMVTRGAFPDPIIKPTDKPGGDWSAVELRADKALARTVTLAEMRGDPRLGNLLLLRHSRLSVMPVGPTEFQHILRLARS